MARFSPARRMSDFLVWVAGGRLDLLALAAGGRARLAAMGGVILSTAVLAVVSASFALHMALNLPYRGAVILGVGWGIVILNLDRMLVIGMGHERSLLRNLSMAVPRLALAVLLGTVISEPLTLQIFHSEISAEMALQQQDRQTEFTQKQAGLGRQIAAAQAQVDKDQTIVNGGAIVDPASDPRVVAAQKDVDAKQAIYNSALASYEKIAAEAQCEFDGTCGTHVVGDGPQYRAALKRANDQKTVANNDASQLAAAQRVLANAQKLARSTAATDTQKKISDAKQDLATSQGQVTTLSNRKAADQKAFQTLNSHDTGILSRLEALEALTSQRSVLRTAHIMLMLLFISVEILPVLMKLLLNMSAETAYEKIVKRTDDQDNAAHDHKARQKQSELDAEAAAAEARNQLVVSNEQDRVDRQREVLKVINAEVTEAQLNVVRKALDIWAARATRESEDALQQYEAQLNGSPVPPDLTVIPPIKKGVRLTKDYVPPAPINGWTAPPPVNGHNSAPSNGRNGAAPSDSDWLRKVKLPPAGEEI